MNQTYRIAGGGDKKDSDEDADSVNETALATGDFQYNCYNCRKQDHKANKCPEKKGNKSLTGTLSRKCGE